MMRRDSSPSRPGIASVAPEAGGFTRMLAVESVPDTGLDVKLCANGAERAQLAEQSGLVSVQSFEAGFNIRKRAQGRLKVSGALEALVTQTCVVTLEPFESVVHADIDVDFAPYGESASEAVDARAAGESPASGSLSGEDPPDPIINGQIDLGALAAEFLVLNLDLYPRKPGAVFEETEACSETPDKDSPFAVLRRSR